MKKHLFFLIVFFFSCSNIFSQIFYKIEGPGLSAPSYLFGTHHMAPLSIIEKYKLMEYLDSVAQVVGEIDLTQGQMALSMAMLPHMKAPADSTLSKIISPEDYDLINEEFKKYTPIEGLGLSTFETMKPMVITTMVTAGMMTELIPDFDPENQIDSYIMAQGKEKDKKIIPLETIEFQAEVLFDSTPLAYQAEALVEMLKDPQESIESARRLNEAYEKEDLDEMLGMSAEDDPHPEFMEALLDRRNADWLTKIPQIIESDPTFIAVGALHLAGDKGIVEGLRKLGFTVTPVIEH